MFGSALPAARRSAEQPGTRRHQSETRSSVLLLRHDPDVYVPAAARYKHPVDLAATIARRVPGLIVSTSPPDQVAYARDLWPRRLIDVRAGRAAATPPAAIAWPTSTEQVAELVAFARAEGMPFVPFGAGSGVCGAVLPDARTIVVDLKRIAEHSIDPRAPVARRRPRRARHHAWKRSSSVAVSPSAISLRASSARPSAAGSPRAAPVSAPGVTAKSRTWWPRSSACSEPAMSSRCDAGPRA